MAGFKSSDRIKELFKDIAETKNYDEKIKERELNRALRKVGTLSSRLSDPNYLSTIKHNVSSTADEDFIKRYKKIGGESFEKSASTYDQNVKELNEIRTEIKQKTSALTRNLYSGMSTANFTKESKAVSGLYEKFDKNVSNIAAFERTYNITRGGGLSDIIDRGRSIYENEGAKERFNSLSLNDTISSKNTATREYQSAMSDFRASEKAGKTGTDLAIAAEKLARASENLDKATKEFETKQKEQNEKYNKMSSIVGEASGAISGIAGGIHTAAVTIPREQMKARGNIADLYNNAYEFHESAVLTGNASSLMRARFLEQALNAGGRAQRISKGTMNTMAISNAVGGVANAGFGFVKGAGAVGAISAVGGLAGTGVDYYNATVRANTSGAAQEGIATAEAKMKELGSINKRPLDLANRYSNYVSEGMHGSYAQGFGSRTGAFVDNITSLNNKRDGMYGMTLPDYQKYMISSRGILGAKNFTEESVVNANYGHLMGMGSVEANLARMGRLGSVANNNADLESAYKNITIRTLEQGGGAREAENLTSLTASINQRLGVTKGDTLNFSSEFASNLMGGDYSDRGMQRAGEISNFMAQNDAMGKGQNALTGIMMQKLISKGFSPAQAFKISQMSSEQLAEASGNRAMAEDLGLGNQFGNLKSALRDKIRAGMGNIALATGIDSVNEYIKTGQASDDFAAMSGISKSSLKFHADALRTKARSNKEIQDIHNIKAKEAMGTDYGKFKENQANWFERTLESGKNIVKEETKKEGVASLVATQNMANDMYGVGGEKISEMMANNVETMKINQVTKIEINGAGAQITGGGVASDLANVGNGFSDGEIAVAHFWR